VSSNVLAGLMQAVSEPPYDGQADLPAIAQALHMEVDDLFPAAEALQLLRLAEVEGGDIRLTEAGLQFARDDTDDRKKLFARHLVTYVPLAAHVRRVNALEPDLVCVTGDLVDRAETCGLAFPTLAGLRARHGVLVTLGNHDFYAGAETVTDALRRLTSFTVLRDDALHVAVDGASLTVVGIDDLGRDWARGVLEHPALPPLAAAVPAGNPIIVLSHRPDCFAQAARLGAALMLAGHTHGGQLALPARLGRRARNLAEFISRFDRGLYRDGDATLYVNRGLGFTGQKVRLFTPREIACLELRPA